MGVGSTNPVKVKATREAFESFWQQEVRVVGRGIESGVPEQPWGEKETIEGARNRAKRVMQEVGGLDYGVGLEGGVTEIEGKLFECAWVVVRNKQGEEGVGGGLYFELPELVAEKIRGGGELGLIMDELTGDKDIKKKGGAIGVFTEGVLTRKQAYIHLVWQALVRFGKSF